MTDREDKGFRRFPNPGWAWPSGPLDRLICAAVCPERDVALDAFREWLTSQNIKEVGFREQRLLAAVAHRFGRDLAEFPQYPRLVALQRQLWTKSSMAVAETSPILRMLEGADIKAMIIKGGARIAVQPGELIARVSHDLDILVHPNHFTAVCEMLFDAGWNASTGESRFRISARSSNIPSLNFFKGRYGDIDLHQWAYGISTPVTDLENTLWDTTQETEFFGVPVFVPSPTDRVAMAICHSGLEAHTHSDWLVDCAQLLSDGGVDWDRLADTLESAQTIIPAQVALSYLDRRLGFELPSNFKSQLFTDQRHGFLPRISAILQAKPRTDWNPITRLARGIAKQIGMARRVKSSDSAPTQKGRIIGKVKQPFGTKTKAAKKLRLQCVDTQSNIRRRFVLEVAVDLPGLPRRIEFELNTDKRHLMRLQARSLSCRKGPVRLRYSGSLDLHAEDRNIWLEARPGRELRGGEMQWFIDRYKQLEFKVLSFKLK